MSRCPHVRIGRHGGVAEENHHQRTSEVKWHLLQSALRLTERISPVSVLVSVISTCQVQRSHSDDFDLQWCDRYVPDVCLVIGNRMKASVRRTTC